MFCKCLLFLSVKVEDPVSLSRWERVDDEEQPKEKKSKWEKVEGVKEGKNIKTEIKEDDEEGDDYKRENKR